MILSSRSSIRGGQVIKLKIDRLIREIAECKDCPRMQGRGGVLGYCGSEVTRDVLFIAEAPGRLGAVRTGLPMSGDASGRNFETLIKRVGWSRDEIWVTNAALCWPPTANGLNDKPKVPELKNCSRFLVRQIEIVDPLVVGALGLSALKALSLIDDIPLGTLGTLVGKPVPWFGRVLVPLFHPSPRVINTVRSLKLQAADFRKVKLLATQLRRGIDPQSL